MKKFREKVTLFCGASKETLAASCWASLSVEDTKQYSAPSRVTIESKNMSSCSCPLIKLLHNTESGVRSPIRINCLHSIQDHHLRAVFEQLKTLHKPLIHSIHFYVINYIYNDFQYSFHAFECRSSELLD